MGRVSIVKCQGYKREEAERAIRETLDNLGGIDKFVKEGDRVLIKPNLLMRKKPEDAVTTHPSLIEALCREIIKAGGHPVIADSPGGPFSPAILEAVYKSTGMEEVARRTGALLNFDTGFDEVYHPEGHVIKRLRVIRCLLQADVIISFSKLKTHGMMLFTGAVKNLFGVIPGLVKVEYHFNMPEIRDFSNMLVDVCTYVKPHLSLIDGVVGMEGEGPSAGKPVNAGVVLASRDPFALDYVAVTLMGINPMDVPTICRARERGLFGGTLEDVDIAGESIENISIKRFETPPINSVSFLEGRFPKPFIDFINNRLRPKPLFNTSICIGCGDCSRSCPPGAISMVKGKPRVDLKRCIRCFCCQELCYYKAIRIHRPWIVRKIYRERS